MAVENSSNDIIADFEKTIEMKSNLLLHQEFFLIINLIPPPIHLLAADWLLIGQLLCGRCGLVSFCVGYVDLSVFVWAMWIGQFLCGRYGLASFLM